MRKAGYLPAAMEARRNLKTIYSLGNHLVEIAGDKGRWTTSVDGVPLETSFETSADAWTAGVRKADGRGAAVAT
jgi:hypothetical protein